MISQEKLDFWVNNDLNVLITGEHGVGKTAIVEATFQRHGMKLFDQNNFNPNELYYLYFSASTMDPFVDLIGIPREQNMESEGTRFNYLDLLRPLPLAMDCVRAIVLDELNRADAKVRNAVMEIIQFKRINGKRFNNLKFVWGMINPEDKAKTYDVERLDPAQVDRFQIHTSIDFKPDKKYFFGKYGDKRGGAAIEWWESLPKEQRPLCSPRRLEYALQISAIPGGDIRDVINHKLNTTRLVSLLQNGMAREKLVELLKAGKRDEAETFLANDNNFNELEPWLLTNSDSEKYRKDIFELMHSERLAKIITMKKDQKDAVKYLAPVFDLFYKNDKILDTVRTIIQTTQDAGLRAMLVGGIPILDSPDIGTDPIKFTPKANSTKVFSTLVAKYNKDEAWKIGANGPNMEILKELANTPKDISTEDATLVRNIMCGVIKHFPVNIIKNNLEEILGPLNFCLEKLRDNISGQQAFKIEVNKLITLGYEKHLWIKKVI